MKKSKNTLEVVPQPMEVIEEAPPARDKIIVWIQYLRLIDEDPKQFSIRVTFTDQLILTGSLNAIGAKDKARNRPILRGEMTFDPSDYEKMCQFADCPLSISIQPVNRLGSNLSEQYHTKTSENNMSKISFIKSESLIKTIDDISCCNIDILELFTEKNKMKVEKRMQPLIKPPILLRKSWNNLPLLSLYVTIKRDKLNEHHHKVFRRANFMKMTLIGAYNMITPNTDEFVYTAASQIPAHSDSNVNLIMFNQGCLLPRRFNSTSFYPRWESLRLGENNFTKGDEKFACTLEDLQNDKNIDLIHYMNKLSDQSTIVWGSFHRSLILDTNEWLWHQICKYKWPLEVHIFAEKGGYSFMSFLNLTNLLYPGEHTVRLAVPLLWINQEAMLEECNCELLLTPNDKASSTPGTTQKPSKSETVTLNSSTDNGGLRPTGADENCAFVVVEIKLGRPLRKLVIPPVIPGSDLNTMLNEIEQTGPYKRDCSGRGQLDRDWHTTVRIAANALRKVPYYGMTEFCTFNRQLSETRTRVELSTSCWQDAAVYVNNNFVVQDFLHSKETYEEMLRMAHACLIKSTCETVVGVSDWQELNPTLRAARHARHMQDIPHAVELYLQLVVNKPSDANSWRELATCLLDVDRDWANVCINKSIVLNPRHPLSLIIKGCMIFEEKPELSDPFFVALLAFYPRWPTVWVAANAYYVERQLFHMAEEVLEHSQDLLMDGTAKEENYPRTWEHELGDWWDYTPLLPGMSPYYDAADMLLRLRAITLAESCLARAFAETGETAAYYHLLALCCRLRGNIDDALCHIKTGITKFGEISYLRTLEAECYNKKNNTAAATASYEKAGASVGAYSTLLSMPTRDQQHARTILVDLVRRQPSAYSWMALADDWIMRAGFGEGGDGCDTDEHKTAKNCAAACCVQSLKYDRRAGKAWFLLSKLVKPSARRQHCLNMANSCGYNTESDRVESYSESQQSLCYHLGTALRECQCKLTESTQF